jgi:LPXTG-motif cell wall-anchored protein
VQWHRCHGLTRQVEVLRDVLLRLLDAPAPQGGAPLEPREIAILCADVAAVAPIAEAVFGGDGPGGAVFSPDGATLYAANYTSAIIAEIDVASAAVVTTLSPSAPLFFGRPWTIAISPDGNYLDIGDSLLADFLTYDINTNEWNSESTVADQYAMFVSPDGTTTYVFSQAGQIDVFDVTDPMNPVLSDSWTDLSVLSGFFEFDGTCVDSGVTTLYAPDNESTSLFAVSLTDGTVVAQNLATNPNSVSQYACAVAPDDSSVFVTDYDFGDQEGPGDPVIQGGLVTEYKASTLAQVAQHDFSGVAYTQMINFYDTCDAYVAGYYGNAQKLTLDTGSCASLPDTGASASVIGTSIALSAGLLVAGALALIVVRRRQHS